MFNIFGNKEKSEIKKLRKEFNKSTKILRSLDESTQITVGHYINIENSYFIDTFSSIDNFMNFSIKDKHYYIETLSEREVKCNQSEPYVSLAINLFKSWVIVLTDNNEVLTESFGDELAYFSRKTNPL